MNPRSERIAYQCWWLIHQTAGECTARDMAALTGASPQTCATICRHRGWATMYRGLELDTDVSRGWRTGHTIPYEASLDALGAA